MLRNHLVVALRTLRRHRGHTALTVAGLALGMAVCLLILTFAWAQARYDAFHARADRIVRVLSLPSEGGGGDDGALLAATPAPLAGAVTREVPGVEAAVRLGQIRTVAVHEGRGVTVTGLYAEPAFFDVFDFEAASGDARAVLAAPGGLLLSAEAAARLFGEADPIGRPLHLEDHGDFLVGGVLAEPPGPSHLRFDVLASFASLAGTPRGAELEDWNNTWRFATYLLLDAPETAARLSAALPAIAERAYAGAERRVAFSVQPLRDIALGPMLGNEIASYSIPAVMVYLLAALGLVVMLAAGFNYVALSVARAMRRTQEVGTRKALGAGRRQVVGQLLTEAVLVALASAALGGLALAWLVPAFNGLAFVQLMDAPIDPSVLADPRLWGLFALFGGAVGVVAGLYPALRLARLGPLAALRDGADVRGFSGERLRSALIGAQFGLALLFVITTALLVAQARHLAQADYGFEREGLLAVALGGPDYGVLREELLRLPEVEAVGATSSLPASGSTMGVGLGRPGAEPVRAYAYAADAGFIPALGLEVLAGRGFSAELASDTAGAVVLNETAVQRLGLGSPQAAVGAPLVLDERPVAVVGVVRDYQYHIPLERVEAMVLVADAGPFRHALVRVRPGALAAAEARAEAVWAALDPVHPPAVEAFDAQLAENPLTRIIGAFVRLLGVVAVLAVGISSLGLLGMAAYHVETRVKEVGVRKVLGASRGAVVWLLTRGFLRLVLLAVALTVPVAWLLSAAWLDLFALRIGVSPWLVGACVALMTALALAVVASQALRAASADPVRALRAD